MIVIDASVIVKLFHSETDSHLAHDAVLAIAASGADFGSPGIVTYEVLAVALHYDVPFEIPLQLFGRMKAAGFQLIEPTDDELILGGQIAATRPKSHGYPELKDSIYHAVAIMRGGAFLTADDTHITKTREFGSAVPLSEWRAALPG